MAQKFVGIDLGNRKVKIAVVTAGLRGAQVNHVWEQEVRASTRRGAGEDPKVEATDAAIDTALRMISERGLGHLPTGVALPGGSGSYRVLSFPFDDPRQIAQAINFELDGQFPLPIEELVTDHIALKRGDGKGRALVVAVKRATIEHVAARMKLADVDLKVITTGALGIAQAMASTPIPALPAGASAELVPVTLVVDFGYKSTELVALGASGPLAARSMRRGGRQLLRELKKAWRLDDEAAAATLERDGSVDDPLVRRALQPLLREIESTRQWLKAEFGAQLVELRLSGGGAQLRGLDRWLAGELSLEVALVEPRESGALRGVQGRDWSGSLVALGTAVATGRRPLIQLHDAFGGASGGEGAWFQQHFSTVASLGIAIMAFAGVDSYVRVQAAARERDAYLAELETETTEHFDVALSTSQDVRDKLAEVESGEAEGGIPARGALEVLELLTKAGAPKPGSDPASNPGALPAGYTQQTSPDGRVIVVDPSGNPVPLDPTGAPMVPGVDPATGAPLPAPGVEPGAEGEVVALAPVPADAGIVADDALLIGSVEIRELKVELSVSATRATAQDRLVVKLEQFACVNKVQPGAVRDRNDRSAFDITIDHNCFTGSTAIENENKGASEDGQG